MARQINKLSARTVATITKQGRHSDGGGLYLVVEKSGSKRWAFLFRQNGRLREMGLGGVTAVTLAEAREKATGCRRTLAAGDDPIAERQGSARGAVPTFGAFADEFIETRKAGWRSERHLSQWAVTLREYAVSLRAKPVNAIETDDVLRVLKPIWSTKHETASRLRGRIEMVLDAARAAGHRTGENPARWRGHLDHLLPRLGKLTKRHHAAMPYQDVPAFMSALRARPAVSSLALEFLILTAARASEALGANWREINLEEKVWTVPRERMKAFREHRVPLSDRALAILAEAKQLHTVGDLVFTGRIPHQPPSIAGLHQLLRRMRVSVRPHGFRSSFRDWAGDATHFPREVAEAALAHSTGDETERAYRRGDALAKRREMMDAWARHCEHRSTDVVIQFPRAG